MLREKLFKDFLKNKKNLLITDKKVIGEYDKENDNKIKVTYYKYDGKTIDYVE